MNKGSIIITLEGVSFEETERYRAIIHLLFERGVFNIKNGKAILNFDELGLAEIESQVKTWKRGKPLLVTKLLEQFKVELEPVNRSTVATRM